MIILFLFVSCYEKNVVGKRAKEYKKNRSLCFSVAAFSLALPSFSVTDEREPVSSLFLVSVASLFHHKAMIGDTAAIRGAGK